MVENAKRSEVAEEASACIRGTDNHLMLVDLGGLELTGKELEHRLDGFILRRANKVPMNSAARS
ncbi:MAG: hypothetical protein ACLRXC_04780 [[Clostridium] leptum]